MRDVSWRQIVTIMADEIGWDATAKVEQRILERYSGLRLTIPSKPTSAVAHPKEASPKPSMAYGQARNLKRAVEQRDPSQLPHTNKLVR